MKRHVGSEVELLHIWLTGQVIGLLDESGRDLEGACAEFDRLVQRWGAPALSCALAEAVEQHRSN